MRLLGFFIFLLCSLPALAAPPEWSPYSSPSGGFQVLAPGDPVIVSTTTSTAMGNVTEYTCRWRVPGLEWVVVYSDVPPIAGSLNGSMLFVQVRRGFEKSSGNPVRDLKLYSYENLPGRSFDFTCKPAEGRPLRNGEARTFLDGSRLYVLTVTWDQAKMPKDRSQADRFFDSFKLAK